MTIDERSRHRLFQRLEEVLGAEEATVLMEHLPPVGWADVATKHDLGQLEERMDLRFEALESRLTAQVSDLRTELHVEIGRLSDRLTTRMTTLFATGLVGVGGLAFAAARLV